MQDPRTHDPSFKYLERGLKLLRLDQEKGNNGIGVNTANYVRCVSGTFHNLAGTLYQAGRHGAAIGFLVNGCKLGQEALSLRVVGLHKDSDSNGSGESTAADQRETDGWKQVEEQLYRRWELLGVCYVKIGDRKVRMSVKGWTFLDLMHFAERIYRVR